MFQPLQLVPSVAARWQCGRRKTWMGWALARGVAGVGASSIDGCSARGGRTRQHSVLLSVRTDGVRCPRLCGAADNVITVCQCCGHAGVSEVLCWVLRKTRSWRRCSAGWDWSSRSSSLCCCWLLLTTWRSPSSRPLFKVVSLLGVMYLRGSLSPLSPHHSPFGTVAGSVTNAHWILYEPIDVSGMRAFYQLIMMSVNIYLLAFQNFVDKFLNT